METEDINSFANRTPTLVRQAACSGSDRWEDAVHHRLPYISPYFVADFESCYRERAPADVPGENSGFAPFQPRLKNEDKFPFVGRPLPSNIRRESCSPGSLSLRLSLCVQESACLTLLYRSLRSFRLYLTCFPLLSTIRICELATASRSPLWFCGQIDIS